MKSGIQYLILLLAITAIIYLPALRNDFNNWDDEAYFTNNPQLELTKDNIKKSFFHGELHRMYVPLTALSNSITYKFFGLHPKPFLVINLLLHLLNIALVFYFIKLICKHNFIALFTAALFALHPMQVEAVAFASGRRDILYVSFLLLSLIFYFFSFENKKNKNIFYFSSLIFAVFSMLSKGQAIMIPFLLLLMDFYFERNLKDKNIWLNKIPFLIFSAIVSYQIYEAPHFASGNFINSSYLATSIPIFNRIIYSCYGYVYYLISLVVPYNLSLVHSYPVENNEYIIPAYFYVFVLVFAVIFYLFLKYALKDKTVFFGLFFFSINSVMLLQFIPNSYGITNDHYVYLAGIGVFFILTEKAFSFLNKKNQVVIYASITFYILVLGYITFQRIPVFKNSISVWTDVIKKYPEEACAYFNRGIAFDKTGNENKAMQDYDKTIQIQPIHVRALLNRAIINDKNGNSKAALSDLNIAITKDSTDPKILMNRGVVLAKIGDFKGSVKDLTKAILLKPDYEKAYFNRGITDQNLLLHENAIKDFDKSIHLNPSNYFYYFRRGLAKRMSSDFKGSVIDFTQAINLKNDFWDAYAERALSYFMTNEFQLSISDCETALKAYPSNPKIQNLKITASSHLIKK